MGEGNKDNDFWNTSDDSFWSKPVVTEDWLKNDTNFESDQSSELNQATRDNPYASSSWSSTYTETSDSRDSFWDSKPQEEEKKNEEPEDLYIYEGESGNDNPYTYIEETAPSFAKPEEKHPEKTYQSAEEVFRQITGEGAKGFSGRKKLSKRRLSCFAFAGITIVCALFFLVLMKVDSLKATDAVRSTKVETIAVDNKFVIFGNNEVTLESSAYHVEKAAHAEGFPEDTMLVAVRCVIISDTYVSNTMIKNPYLGFDYEGETLYIKASSNYTVNDYLWDTKYYNEVLSPYGEGNGLTSEGYYCFMVPIGAENPRIYFEETKNVNHVDVTTKIFEKELNFNRFSKEHTESQEDQG